MMTLLQKNQGTVLAAVAAISWLGALYLVRQNRLLRQELEAEHNTMSDATNNNKSNDNAPQRISNDKNDSSTSTTFELEEIGTITSPFPQRAGCPRQGTLAPHVVSRFNLHSHIPNQVLDGIQEYSHVWIVFGFHLNPRPKAKNFSVRNKNNKFVTMVRPPRAPHKMGVLATRSPHRPNAIGLSLALLDGVSKDVIVLRGLDLVDGTPVYDIKPYVPFDQVPSKQDTIRGDIGMRMNNLMVPPWVSSKNDELDNVSWTNEARDFVFQATRDGLLSPLYPPNTCDDNNVFFAIEEIITQDPRALRDGRGTESCFEFSFCCLRVSFRVEMDHDAADMMRVARVVSVIVDQGDVTTARGSYPHHLALRRAAEQQYADNEKKRLQWKYPVREGMTQDVLYELKDGGHWNPSREER